MKPPVNIHFDGSVQDCSNSNALALELLQSCTEPSIFFIPYFRFTWTYVGSVFIALNTTTIPHRSIICINGDPAHWCVHASVGGEDIKEQMLSIQMLLSTQIATLSSNPSTLKDRQICDKCYQSKMNIDSNLFIIPENSKTYCENLNMKIWHQTIKMKTNKIVSILSALISFILD